MCTRNVYVEKEPLCRKSFPLYCIKTKFIALFFRLTISSNEMGQTKYLGRLKWKHSKHPRYERTCVRTHYFRLFFMRFFQNPVSLRSFFCCCYCSEIPFLEWFNTPSKTIHGASLRYSHSNGCVFFSIFE